MRLLIQPEDGILPLVKGISGAKNSIEIVIFRFDQREIERALANAVSRGVSVHALIASTNRAGEENLRQLELRLLAAGITVARTADDLVRYHSKLMIIDRRELYLLAFNWTHLDMDRSRSFGLITRSRDIVREAAKLFECDTKRIPYEPSLDSVVVSPVNARKALAGFIREARRELIVYDPKVSDRAMIRLLAERAKAGVNVRIIGRLAGRVPGVTVRKLAHIRLHTRTMVRDGQVAFVGSQSLRQPELDARRELGLIFRDARAVNGLLRTFESDWVQEQRTDQDTATVAAPSAKIAKRVAKAVAKEIPPVAPIVNGVLQAVVGEAEVELIQSEVEEVVKDAVRQALEEVVRGAVEGAVEKGARVTE
ncbi:MAG TPA: phospholipase D-like domain-containing protein [Bryobacteraceae bacterium]|nr:phospholipase D-like domain-containing protein [Bryobacteraceae bacterium]